MVALAVTVELLIAAMLGLLGYFYWSDPEHFRSQMIDAVTRSPRVLRVLSPLWLYRGKLGLWQVRIMAVGAFLISAVLLFAAMATLISAILRR
jgi:hypothetical protein